MARREFLEFCRARTPMLFRVAYGFTADQQLAEDLLQTALERTARRWARVDDPEAYVRRVMYHEFVSWWRRWRRRETSVAEPPDRPDPADPIGAADLRRAAANGPAPARAAATSRHRPALPGGPHGAGGRRDSRLYAVDREQSGQPGVGAAEAVVPGAVPRATG